MLAEGVTLVIELPFDTVRTRIQVPIFFSDESTRVPVFFSFPRAQVNLSELRAA
jgi:hypothetical protein